MHRPALLLVLALSTPLFAQTLSVIDTSGTEPAPGQTSVINVPVRLDRPAGSEVTFDYSTTSESANGGSDFVSASGSGVIPAGAIETFIPVTLQGDGQPEKHETFVVQIRNVRGATPGRTVARITILDSDPVIFHVNSADTTDDGACDSAHCSLREAIRDANIRAGVRDRIHFEIPGEGPHVINHARLPLEIADPVVIDGYTQPGAHANSDPARRSNAVIQIEIRGDDTSLSPYALQFLDGSRGSVVRGIAFGRFPIAIHLDGAADVTIGGCFIGTNAGGRDPVPNQIGIVVERSSNVRIGGVDPDMRNVIGGNRVGVLLRSSATTGTWIVGNLIGVNPTGRESVSNAEDGVHVEQGPIAGTRIEGNVIGGSGETAIDLTNTTDVLIAGNDIGISSDGTAAIPNFRGGVQLFGASRTQITGNHIANNNGPGVWITGSQAASANRIRNNRIHDNVQLGIDLTSSSQVDSVTANDSGDVDTGANGMQNFPVLISAAATATFTTVRGTLNSHPNETYTIELFSNAACDPTGHGEGETPIAAFDVVTDANGNASFARNVARVAPGRVLTATAAAADGSTSELGRCVAVTTQVAPVRRRSARK
ncbi:MAG TPA: right-handed parallel beta-helix repeat-containing protein [Thermoanaerobaculia bacterium]